jgi:hypothetical protein
VVSDLRAAAAVDTPAADFLGFGAGMLFWLPMLWREAYPVDTAAGRRCSAKGKGGTTVV